MTLLLIIALGGALGSLARYGLSLALYETFRLRFPLGIFCVNVLGCFLMGFLATYFLKHISTTQALRSFLLVGFLGAFTTFSTFSMDFLSLVQDNQLFSAACYLIGTVSLGIIATILGLWLAGQLP